MNADHFLEQLDKAVEDAQDRSHRKHLGASLIGRQCARQLWYVFRWALKEEFSGRMLRLFERGQLEEDRFVGFLRATGATVYDRDPQSGDQFRILDVDGHFGGSCDGVAVNLPQLPPGMPCVLEMKTHSEDSFAKLAGKIISKSPKYVRSAPPGVRKAKPEHFVQMQTYMHKLNIEVGLYLAVNKNTDEIYAEFIQLDRAVGERAIARARSIIYSDEAPARISESPGWFECKFCAFVEICHLKALPEVNCRTCCHSTPGPNGLWTCARGHAAVQLTPESGCPEHLYNPHLLKIVQVVRGDTEANWLELLRLDGTVVKTGPNHVTSRDLTL